MSLVRLVIIAVCAGLAPGSRPVPVQGPYTAQQAPQPHPDSLASWLGRWKDGPDEITLGRIDGRLLAQLGDGTIFVPADGEWHETESTFSVRHRLTWLPERKSFRLEEQHNQGAHWTWDLRLEGDVLLKVVPGEGSSEEDFVQRRYRRAP